MILRGDNHLGLIGQIMVAMIMGTHIFTLQVMDTDMNQVKLSDGIRDFSMLEYKHK